MHFRQTITADGVYPLNGNYAPIDVLAIYTYGTWTLDGATVTLGVLNDTSDPTNSASYDAFTTFSSAPSDEITFGGEVLAIIVSSAGASTSLPIRAKDLRRNT